MSWGGPYELPEVKHAIREAFHLGVSMFAAASNDGGLSTVAFPASLRQVICVNAYDGYGRPSNFNPEARPGTNLAVLGEFVEAAWPLPRSDAQTVRKAGTSVATPIAAGLAALILEYSRQDGPAGSRVEHRDQLRHCDEVRKVLQCMSRNVGGFQCLVPGDLFYKRFRDRTLHSVICSKINASLMGLLV
jgi:subtilisin family serine protease